MSRRVIARIQLGALRRNLARIRRLAPTSRVMAVVKADGYGHGLERVVTALQDADAFGVASIADGERIRALGLAHRIVVLSGIDEPGDLARMHALGLEPVIHHDSQLELLRTEWPGVYGQGLPVAHQKHSPQAVWIKLDTGMHRLGFPQARLPQLLEEIRSLPGIGDIQVMTHFANSDVADDPSTQLQMERFATACNEGVADSRRDAFAISLANSAAITGFPESHGDWVRAGGLIYGITVVEGRCGSDLGFEPAMILSARVIAINDIAAGDAVGYGGTWRAARATKVGVLAVGYADGYPRAVGPHTPVSIGGVEAAVIGRVSMDLITVDLTDLTDVAVGETAVLWGAPGIPVERIARAAGTIGYELVCGMTRRVDFEEDDS